MFLFITSSISLKVSTSRFLVETFWIASYPAIARNKSVISFCSLLLRLSLSLFTLASASKHLIHVSINSESSSVVRHPIGDAIYQRNCVSSLVISRYFSEVCSIYSSVSFAYHATRSFTSTKHISTLLFVKYLISVNQLCSNIWSMILLGQLTKKNL